MSIEPDLAEYMLYKTSEGHNAALQIFEGLPSMSEQEESEALQQLKEWPRKNVQEAWDAFCAYRGIKGVPLENLIGVEVN